MGLARALAPEPQVLLLDEPFGALDARVRAELREWLRQLHDVVHVTTVFVTHDQEEAMEISDQIAVINHGTPRAGRRPRELYDEPASEFVMTFVGDANVVGDVLVRPHDLELSTSPRTASIEAMIVRVTHPRPRCEARAPRLERGRDRRADHAGPVRRVRASGAARRSGCGPQRERVFADGLAR